MAIVFSVAICVGGTALAENTCDVVLKLATGRVKQADLWSSQTPSGKILSALRKSFLATTKVKRSTLPKDSEALGVLEAAAEEAANDLEYLCAFWFFQKNRSEEAEALRSHLR